MTLFAYRLQPFFLNGWVDVKTMLASYSDIDEGDEYVDSWRRRIAERLEAVSLLFLNLGLREEVDKLSTADVWFAAVPTADGPLVESEFIVAVVTETEAYVASPVELPWLKAKALSFLRSEMMDPPGSEVVH